VPDPAVNIVDTGPARRQDRPMDIAVVDPELRAATTKLPAPNTRNPVLRAVIRIATRLLPTPRVDGVTLTTVRQGAVRALVYRPDAATTDAGVLWIHGGGFVIGSAKQDHRLCAGTAAELGITVVSAEYRLAPDHPFPAPLDDVTAVWEWMLAHAADLGIDPARIVVAGESAGGGLAATLVQRLRDTSPVQPVAQWLFCPMLDDRTAADRSLDAADHFIWNNDANAFGWRSYLGRDPGSAGLPDYAVAARRADLTGLPPTWICVGDIELFHDEDLAYAERLRAAHVDVTLDVVPGAPHGFENWAGETAPAVALVARARHWLAATLGITTSQ
jgi:acetyl esterase/lipase